MIPDRSFRFEEEIGEVVPEKPIRSSQSVVLRIKEDDMT